ncbi:MAG: indole-3-glycerol phosphate synthase [Gammaproteobacteria bacterium RIFCSPHIGHO2_12_FULL_45_9]|nr:MAG: indole-3-glycerol phosphate synthase [Gammaproteobacteria bacterium RIFCSPHIGHO2_12_FULL_45_9]
MQLTADVPLNTLDFCDAFNVQTIPAIIAEIKFASPSRGRIYHGALDALAIAGEYLAHGASALSILTEPEYFQGNIASIRAVRRAFPTAHILLKDFILSELQVAQALACGANAVLLIVAFLTEQRLRLLYEYALTLGLTPLIEVHDADELKKALALNPRMIGINHRNLNTLEIDLECSTSLIRMIPEGVYCVAESGIERKSHLDMMATRGFNGCLIGSSFMQHDHPGHALQHMISGDDDAG